LVFIDTRDVHSSLGRADLAFDVFKPTLQEQHSTWEREIGRAAPETPALLAGQFNLNQMAIHEIVESVVAQAPEDMASALWQACVAHTRPHLDTLAQRLSLKATWDDLVLPENSLDLLRQVTHHVRHRIQVYDEWGFARRMNRGLGIVVLFAGESGTGKTMAAEVIANELRLNLYRIDLSSVVSKYIGETEKNLRRLFDGAEDGGAILFFDEADALFGKRSQVRDSHDRYANIEVNYLLQRMEAYQGLAILSTNLKSDMDEAFSRRFRFIINFPFPDRAARDRLWRQIYPPETPLARLDYDYLAQFEMAGGNIQNAALNAAFQAAQHRMPVTMQLILSGIRAEFLKTDRLIDEATFIWDG
jgi:AAA+ superfamily predicted ATPase